MPFTSNPSVRCTWTWTPAIVFAVEPTLLVLKLAHHLACFGNQLGLTDLQELGQLANVRFELLHQGIGSAPALCLDPPHSGRDTGFGDNAEQPDLAGMTTVGATTQFLAKGFDSHHSNLLAVLVSEECQRTLGHGILYDHHFCLYCFNLSDLVVDHHFDIVDIPVRQWSEMRKVEPEPIRPDQRPVL